MATRARKLDKSVHSTEQAVFCELMIKARKTADLTQHELAKRLRRPQSFVAKCEGERRKAFSPIRKVRAISQKLYSHSQPNPYSV
jgi:predicted transcriptional regulator